MEYTVVLVNLLFSVMMLGGVAMTMVGLPGNVIIVVTGLAYGYYDHFEHIDYAILAIVIGIFIIGEIVEFGAGLVGAKQGKASKRSMVAAIIGTVVGGIWGTAILPLFGSILGALLGAFVITALAEYTKVKNAEQAKHVAISLLKGQIIGMVFKIAAAVGMAIILIERLQWHQ